ncbi:MAG: 50S ribosomal protein L18 [Phycisphaerae bacterium]
MADVLVKARRRRRRKLGIRKRVIGCAERPRLTVFRSSKHIYVQIIDDQRGLTLCEVSTRSKELRDQIKNGGNVAAAKLIGAAVAKRAQEKHIECVCFDRNGYKFHGRVKGLADAAREAGLKF